MQKTLSVTDATVMQQDHNFLQIYQVATQALQLVVQAAIKAVYRQYRLPVVQAESDLITAV